MLSLDYKLNWLKIPEWNIILRVPPKNGSRSVQHFLIENDIEHMDIRPIMIDYSYEVYFVVRDPVDRFKSVWRNKCRDPLYHPRKYKKNHISNHVKGMSPEQLMDFIESGFSDGHIEKQTNFLREIKAELIPLPRLNEWWSMRGYGDLTTTIMPHHVTAVDDTVFDDALIKRIERFYANDVELYKRSKLDMGFTV